MPAIGFDDIDTNLRPVPGWRFFVTLPSLPGMAEDGSTLSFLVQRFIGTARGIQYEQVPFQGGVRNFPTGFHVDNITVVLVETDRFVVSQYLAAWCNLVVDARGVFGMPATYKRRIAIEPLDETGASLGRFGWNFCSPTVPDPFEWDGTNSHYLTSGCSFVTDGPLGDGSNSGIVAAVSDGPGDPGSGNDGNIYNGATSAGRSGNGTDVYRPLTVTPGRFLNLQ